MSPNTMWSGQSELRWSMERLADDALDRSGIELDPRGFLIGLPEHDEDLPIKIEPSRRAFDLDHLDGLMRKALRRYRRRVTTVPEDEVHQRAALLEACRREIVVEALTTAARFDDRTVCVGLSVVVGDYRVFPVLAVRTEPWEDIHRLRPLTVDGLALPESFPDAVVHDVLRAASRELDRITPTSLMGVDAGAVLRSAADSFVNGVVARAGQEFAHGVRDALDAVSAQTYEGRASLGSLALAPRGDECVEAQVTFEHEIPLTVARSLRKALEMSGRGLRLLTDGRIVHGLGDVKETYDPRQQRCFVIQVVGNGTWELWHAGAPLLRVEHGHPSLPGELVDPGVFADTLRRVFRSRDCDAEALWEMTQECVRQQHGTMLVVHPDAAEEGRRLLPQAYTIEPTRLGPTALRSLTNVDGAVLVSPDGVCHAVGVILDGAATGTGDGSRGARYNSAIRYLAGEGRGSMVIIVSEDGRIDLLPHLRRRVRRDTVQKALDTFVQAVEDEEEYEKLARLDNRCSDLEFYFDTDQCEVLNQAREAVEQRRWEEERVRLQVVPVQPHPAMDDGYFLDPVT